jgi:hypothetical protein
MTTNQLSLDVPRDLKEIRVTVKLNNWDLKSLRSGMNKVGETNMSSYIRRLIHTNK